MADHERRDSTIREEHDSEIASMSHGSEERLLFEGSHVDFEKREPEYRTSRNPLVIDRWWKLLVFLVVCSITLPFAVQLSMRYKLSRHPPSSDTLINQSWTRPADDYSLSLDWDLDAAPQLREYHWSVSDAVINPDGVFRQMLVINGQYPGPLIRANEGDTIRVVVENAATNATSFHWHGIYQNGTNHMDGTVGITQCPIAPGYSFTYEFKLDGQSGTYWYHGHHGVQAADGLFGPLIIHSKDERQIQEHDYVSDRIVMLSDHYHELSGALMVPYLASDNENTEPVPDSALINGRGIRDCSQFPHRLCDNSTENISDPVFDLEPNTYHRLRLINVGVFAEFQFQIDEHELAVTEVDGTDVHPISYHRVNLAPAQRYSVVVHTNATASSSFWMRARMITTCFRAPNPTLKADINVVVTYTSADTTNTTLPTSRDWADALLLQCRDLNTTELVPYHAVSAPEADDFFYIRANFEIGAYRLSRGFFNSTSWRPDPRSPSLLRTIDGLNAHNTSFHPSLPATINEAAFDTSHEFVLQTSGIRTIDLLLANFEDGSHPLHLHGYKFFILAQGPGGPPVQDRFRGPDRANIQPLYDGLDTTNPLRRDTVQVPGYSWVLIRVVADNPGLWALHCHVGWHAEAGLVMQLATRVEGLVGMETGAEHRGLCAAPGVEKGAGPKDEDYYY